MRGSSIVYLYFSEGLRKIFGFFHGFRKTLLFFRVVFFDLKKLNGIAHMVLESYFHSAHVFQQSMVNLGSKVEGDEPTTTVVSEAQVSELFFITIFFLISEPRKLQLILANSNSNGKSNLFEIQRFKL